MRKVFWILGAFSVVGLAMTAGTAQERAPSLYRTAPSSGPATAGAAAESDALQKERLAAEAAAFARPGTEMRPSGLSPDQVSNVGILRYERARPAPSRPGADARTAGAQPALKNYQKELFGAEGAAAASPEQTNTPKTGLARGPIRDSAIRPAGAVSAEESPIQQAGGLMPPGRLGAGVRQADHHSGPAATNAIRQVSGTQAAPKLPANPGAGPALLPATAAPAAPSLSRTAAPASVGGIITNFTKDAPHVRVEWKKLSDINVGQPGTLDLIVRNDGNTAAADVQISAFFPNTIRLTKADPMPESAEGSVLWRLPKLDAGETQHISVTLIPSQRGEITTNANVRYTTAATASFAVEEPQLKLAVAAPKEVMIGEIASHIVTVSNPGTGTAQSVIIEVTIPEGLVHEKGQRLKMDIGALAPNESRSIRLPLTAKAGGEHAVQIEARAGADILESSVAKTSVIAPSIKVAVEGPSLRFVGRDARYSVAVTNDGHAASNNVRAVYVVPKGFAFQSASNGGRYDDASRTVSWFIGTLNAGQKADLSLKLTPNEEGDFAHVVKAFAEHAAASEATTATKIEGTASLALEVVDLDDPVETGRETAYEIRIRNEGTRDAQNVGLSLELPASVELIAAKGPSAHIAESGLVVFKSLPSLAPGKSVTFQVHVKGTEEGNHRVRARLTSESIQEPLTIEELTRFYAE